ncbi:PREDICTED: uncharacterized protein LOC18589121 isoform X2 [Theobroma cacao]|uniref:Uncharacterized protein LOC18589121 isoform X2 n=1 Tax=Theobroma cacao TaxID=3641 RepID=A0AB32WVX1_THECC|nr:PREDICTED: uncharacterized protein LOC18589121 isoform X2 [Theobroma cacao]
MASSGCSILTLALAAVFSASSAISCILFLYLFSSLFFLCSYLELYFICICMFTFFLSVFIYRKKWVESDSKVKELQKSLNSALEKCAAERQGRIRAQQALRKAVVAQPKCENSEMTSYPMAPIGVIQSCFSTRNGTPRQPLLVPLARACLVFDSARVPPASLEGLEEYSHCWIIYVFHLNTDLEKLWKHPSKSKFKAKVRVPRLKGGRMGVFATRSPHRPCPIGLTVAKVEAVQENMLLLSGVDLVDGTVDSMLSVASVSFSDDFPSSLLDCWKAAAKNSLYSSPDELKSLVKQVLSWDIRSLSQRTRPHDTLIKIGNGDTSDNTSDMNDFEDGEASGHGSELAPSGEIIYHLILDGMDFSYKIDCNGNVIVEKVDLSSRIPFGNQKRCNYLMWKDKLM